MSVFNEEMDPIKNYVIDDEIKILDISEGSSLYAETINPEIKIKTLGKALNLAASLSTHYLEFETSRILVDASMDTLFANEEVEAFFPDLLTLYQSGQESDEIYHLKAWAPKIDISSCGNRLILDDCRLNCTSLHLTQGCIEFRGGEISAQILQLSNSKEMYQQALQRWDYHEINPMALLDWFGGFPHLPCLHTILIENDYIDGNKFNIMYQKKDCCYPYEDYEHKLIDKYSDWIMMTTYDSAWNGTMDNYLGHFT